VKPGPGDGILLEEIPKPAASRCEMKMPARCLTALCLAGLHAA
jgi:hypothetical protein